MMRFEGILTEESNSDTEISFLAVRDTWPSVPLPCHNKSPSYNRRVETGKHTCFSPFLLIQGNKSDLPC